MREPWHVAKPELRTEVERYLAETHPGLIARIDSAGVFSVMGSYRIPDVDAVHARYAIEIVFPWDYPDDVPIVREVGGRIPRSPDRHVNDDGTACVMVPEEWLVRSHDRSFPAFMAGPVRDFFIGQSLVELGEPWPFGERSHGYSGVLEAFSELLGVQDQATMQRYLAYLEKPVIKGHWPCPCGSGEMLRRCHRDHVRDLQTKITPMVATRMIKRLGP